MEFLERLVPNFKNGVRHKISMDADFMSTHPKE
jgi:hypothetical protein